MDFYRNNNQVQLANWVKNFFILDIIIYISSLLIFPNLWSNGYNFVLLITGTIVSYLISEKLIKFRDNNWGKLAEMLVSVDISLNAIFCIIISSAIIIGVFIAANA